MTQQQFEELKFLIQGNAQGIRENTRWTRENAQGISRNFEMIGRIYEEHGGRLTRLEVSQEQLSHDLRAVAEGVTGNTERLGRFEGRFDAFEMNFDHLSANVTARSADHEQRLGALED